MVTPNEKQMFADLYRFLEAHIDDWRLEQWEPVLDEFRELS